jgi:hypothetical protein
MYMFSPEFDLLEALAHTLNTSLIPATGSHSGLLHDGEFWVFINDETIANPLTLKASRLISSTAIPPNASGVNYVLTHWTPTADNLFGKETIQFGHIAVSVRFALRKLLDLPSTFESSQNDMIDEALSPITGLEATPVSMSLVDADCERYPDGSQKLASLIDNRDLGAERMLFIEAEAGRGKTILLASQAKRMQANAHGRLAIYIPLRKLPLESGVSIESFTKLVGVVGKGAERLAKAIRNGLVTLFLDGIDEVSGRYDKNLINELQLIITSQLGGEKSVVVLSGRKTEARHLDTRRWETYNVVPPDIKTAEFRLYVGAVLQGLINQSKALAEMPTRYGEVMGLRAADAQVVREREEIIEWILDVFPEIALEPSLFFIQGLAAIAIGCRSGNRKQIRRDGIPFLPSVSDVCLSAAVFACLREISKISPDASRFYNVDNQMSMLQGLAAIASAPSLSQAPTPNELVQAAFDIDPVHATEEYLAIQRQNAKHALLWAMEAAVGGYRPQFLDDWIRCALLTRIFETEVPMHILSRSEILKLNVSALRAEYTYDILLPSWLEDRPIPLEWATAFKAAIADNIPSASANQWSLRAAVGDDRMQGAIEHPLALAEITGREFHGFSIGDELSGNDFLLDGTLFSTSTIRNVRLQSVSMLGVRFVDCEIMDCLFESIDGPISFDDCTFSNVTIKNTTSKKLPALSFRGCRFTGDRNRIEQAVYAHTPSDADQVADFNDCYTDADPASLLFGDWAGKREPLMGISKSETVFIEPSESCLRRALRAFFPSQIGSMGGVQARPYIRLSALGRGSMPPGSPGQEQLKQILETVGFTTGGRFDHLYGPWSSVAGPKQDGMELRNELTKFILDSNDQGPRVKQLLGKLQSYFN